MTPLEQIQARLKEIKARADAATPSPWGYYYAEARTDIPKLVEALEVALKSMKSACYCTTEGPSCEHCDEDSKEIARILGSKE